MTDSNIPKAICPAFMYCLNILFLLIFLSSPLTAKGPSGKKKIVYSHQVKLTLTYRHDFSCLKECRKNTVENCSKSIQHPHKLMCIEEVKLIRPRKLAYQWQKEQYHHGHINFTIKEFGINHVRARIISAIPFTSKSFKKKSENKSKELVTGLFKIHTFNVRKYILKNIDTGMISSIHTTPDHLFYLQNRQDFLPIKISTEKDTMITSNGNPIKLISCRGNTSTTYKNKTNIPRLVYNLEIRKKHAYFVGSDKILVHNICQCAICGQQLENPSAIKVHIQETHGYHLSLAYECGINKCTKGSSKINTINLHQFTAHGICNINSCPLCGTQLCNQNLLIDHLRLKCMLQTNRFGNKKFQAALYLLEKDAPLIIKQSEMEDILSKNTLESRTILALFLSAPSTRTFYLSDPFSYLTDEQLEKKITILDKELPGELLPHTRGHL